MYKPEADIKPPAPSAVVADGIGRFAVLDLWRTLAILLILTVHLVPLGPRGHAVTRINAELLGNSGMALFFAMSGFLVTRFVAKSPDLRVFMIRRLVRIVPLAWLAMLVALPMAGADAGTWVRNVLFIANLPPISIVPTAAHLWSLCVEMQFYAGIALLAAIFGKRGLYALPLIGALITGLRVVSGVPVSIVTYLRVDEIIAGGILALIYDNRLGPLLPRLLGRTHVGLALVLLALSSMEISGPFQYAKPYCAALVVGSSLYNSPRVLARLASRHIVSYIATISYALYIIQGVLGSTWLTAGDTLVRYAKRPLMIGATFGLAHLSTFRFERPLIDWVKDRTRGHPVVVSG